MKVLLHICCAPCSITAVETLRAEEIDVMGFFYRHNIHPFTECMKREDTLKDYARTIDLKVIYQQDYQLERFLQSVVFREPDRCRFCYHDRLTATAKMARKGKFDAFTTTLLYSKFQNHDLIVQTGEAIARSIGPRFLYRDFRGGWKEGIRRSKDLKMYRQQYCGCIYSEKERYYSVK